jgi:hypothetical protein
MFEGKTLVGLGCSHTHGVYEQDHGLTEESIMSCHDRAWPAKLGKIGNFKDVINLSTPGGSNHRSERFLIDFLSDNQKDWKDVVVIFTITELSRFETVNVVGMTDDELHKRILSGPDWGYLTEGIWKLNSDQIVDSKRRQFLEYYYSIFSHHEADVEIINRKVLMISSLLHRLGIEHYFLEMLCAPETIKEEQIGFKIPMINFIDGKGPKMNAIDWMTKRFERGTCGHFDHDANQALADYIYDQLIKKEKQ